ncbi:MAG: hypothetical protein H7343_11040 [Undibacterium sp.]|nr:hypothetical protein [Opitutaceae bacterium]
MANKFHNNPAKRPAFEIFLNESAGFVPKKVAAAFAIFEKQYDAASAERAKYAPTEAQRVTDALRDKTHADPTPANLAAYSAQTAGEVHARYANTANALANIQNEIVERNKWVGLAILEAVLPIVDREIETVETTGRKAFAEFGAVYDPAQDYLLLSLSKWRDLVTGVFNADRPGARPDQVRDWFGLLPVAKGLLG